MGIRARPEDGADADAETIPATISKLKMSFRPADYERAERVLLARESNLRREIQNLRKENARLLEASQFHELEMLRVETESKSVILEQRRRITELERQKLKLEGLVVREYEGWKGLVSKLEADARKMSGGDKERSGGVEVKLEMEVDEIAASSVSGENGGVKDSGIRKFPSGDACIHEYAPMDTEIPCEKSDSQKDSESLSLAGVEWKPRVHKRKPGSSLSISDDDKRGENFKEDENSYNEKQSQKLSLPLIDNHCTEKLDFSGIKVSEIQSLPNHEQVKSRVSEQKIMAEQKSQVSLIASLEVSSDSDTDSSSSSDSEDDNLLQSQLDDILQKVKAREGSHFV